MKYFFVWTTDSYGHIHPEIWSEGWGYLRTGEWRSHISGTRRELQPGEEKLSLSVLEKIYPNGPDSLDEHKGIKQ